jgi:hypothetical protein
VKPGAYGSVTLPPAFSCNHIAYFLHF